MLTLSAIKLSNVFTLITTVNPIFIKLYCTICFYIIFTGLISTVVLKLIKKIRKSNCNESSLMCCSLDSNYSFNNNVQDDDPEINSFSLQNARQNNWNGNPCFRRSRCNNNAMINRRRCCNPLFNCRRNTCNNTSCRQMRYDKTGALIFDSDDRRRNQSENNLRKNSRMYNYTGYDPDSYSRFDGYNYNDNNGYSNDNKYSDNNDYSDNDKYNDNNDYSDNSQYSDNNDYSDNDKYIDNNDYSDNDKYNDNNGYNDKNDYNTVTGDTDIRERDTDSHHMKSNKNERRHTKKLKKANKKIKKTPRINRKTNLNEILKNHFTQDKHLNFRNDDNYTTPIYQDPDDTRIASNRFKLNNINLIPIKDTILKPIQGVLINNNAQSQPPLTVDELNKDLEPYGFAYDPNKDLFYSNMNCWQREFGYCRLYDEGCATLSMIVDSEPIYFNYDGRSWLIELWKGQYGLNTGCEMGVYNSSNIIDADDVQGAFYNTVTDDELLDFEFTLYKNKKFLLSRKETHWWLTAFKLGEFSQPSELTLDSKITFKNEEMLKAFLGGLKSAGYAKNDYSVDDLTVHIIFDKPKTQQPRTRTPVIEFIMQLNNRLNCNTYQTITKDYDYTLDKISYLRQKAPGLYRKLMDLGKSTAIIKSYQSIANKKKNEHREKNDDHKEENKEHKEKNDNHKEGNKEHKEKNDDHKEENKEHK